MRGKKGGAACGDRVEIKLTTSGQGVIETILPRSTLLYRSDAYREKLIAANVTQMIIVVAAVPSFSEELINRCLAAAENQRIRALIILNKGDLIEPTRTAAASLSLYRELGYPLLQISAKTSAAPLLPYLKGQLSVMVGQSGMGKSTLINALIPEAERATAGISIALDTGRHTTTHARLFHLDESTCIIDSPGMQEFGLRHIDGEDLAWEFIEFRPYIGRCKFNDCRHADEPGCALAEAAHDGKISRRRFNFYHKLATLSGTIS
ncbi:ribosome small subunit-dependent GTPase A [Nitrosospira lacus]|uniref:Small ribosomal subunit biogenesis GTPase RsgA n=1 Tax=Nitrosospira lacus TaxID=1288494 RepID=A0A1W6SND5_9PROT|nr:ribosome small subunit-dependent GTPase A [Nitrosospira lacus]ARO87320.1 ribosome small subunit-dependent GTPase A [Nitrosospira lacus]